MGIKPVPATEADIAMYAAYLARRLQPSSVRQYLNVVRLIHLECSYANPCKDSWLIKSTLVGIERLLGSPIHRKAPITPALLLQLKSRLDQSVLDVMFWAAATVMFFGTFRKSNLLPDKSSAFSKEKQFTRADFIVSQEGYIMINVKWSKTNQFKKYCLHKKLFKIASPLCPVKAIMQAFELIALPPGAPAFVCDVQASPMTGVVFNRHLKQLVEKCGLNSKDYASHSFRRGSATWALECGVPGEIVQHLGDWKSDAYLAYVDRMPQSVYDKYMLQCLSHLP